MIAPSDAADPAGGPSRRDVLRGGAAGLGLLALEGLAIPGSAEAASLWNPGPCSGLPYWLGGYAGIDELNALMQPRRALDLVHIFEPAGSYQATTTALAGWFPRMPEVAMLASGRAAGLQWSSSPFCYGTGQPIPSTWPSGPEAVTADLWLNTARPPTSTGSESPAERTVKQRRLWRMAAQGWLDMVWRAKLKAIKRDCFVRMGLRDIRIVLRVAAREHRGPCSRTERLFGSHSPRLGIASCSHCLRLGSQ